MEPGSSLAERREAIDRDVRSLLAANDTEAATTLASKEYGPELHSFLVALARDRQLADEAFADACERLWRGLATFRWEATLRTWAYQLARNALYRARRSPHARVDRNLPLSLVTSIAAVPRSTTPLFQRTELKNEVRALIDALEPEDFELVVLRLDRRMSWKDIARATAEDDLPTSAVDQRAAMCRKRFERIKAQLRERLAERGLLGDD